MYKLDKDNSKKVIFAVFLTSAIAFGAGTGFLEDKIYYYFDGDNIDHIEVIDDNYVIDFANGNIETISRDELTNSGLKIGNNSYEFANGEKSTINMQQPIGASTMARTAGVVGMIGSIVAFFNRRNNIDNMINTNKTKKYI